MSYDITIGSDEFNYTFNVANLFYDHMPPDEDSDRGGLDTLDGCTGKEASRKISEALKRIEKTRHDLWENGVMGEPKFCAKYDAKNGWGSTIGAIMLLSNLMAACHQNPRKRVRVYA